MTVTNRNCLTDCVSNLLWFWNRLAILAQMFSPPHLPDIFLIIFQHFLDLKKHKKSKSWILLQNTEPYNQFFTIQNLKDALHDSHDSVPGADDIHYQVLKHLPVPSLEVLLHIFNKIWDTGTFLLFQLPSLEKMIPILQTISP